MIDFNSFSKKISIPRKLNGTKQNMDFNFFYPYLGKKKETKNKYLYMISAGVFILLILGGSFIWNMKRINSVKKEITALKSVVDSPETQDKIKQADKLNKKYDIIKKYYDGVEVISTAVDNKQVVSSELIRKLSSAIPHSVSFKTVSIDAQSIQIQGTAGSRVNIGEFQHNLKKLDGMKDVQVMSINKNTEDKGSNDSNEGYTFTLKCLLKDVDNNESH